MPAFRAMKNGHRVHRLMLNRPDDRDFPIVKTEDGPSRSGFYELSDCIFGQALSNRLH